jgi:hypothetical protein
MPTHPQGVGKVRRLPLGITRNRRTLSRRCPQKRCPAILSEGCGRKVPTSVRRMCRPARAVVVLLLLHCGAHAQSEMFSMRQAQSIFSIWGNDCHLPLNDTQREVEDERVEATGRPPPEQAPPCPDGYSCRRCFSRKDCKEDQGQCAVRYLGWRTRLCV